MQDKAVCLKSDFSLDWEEEKVFSSAEAAGGLLCLLVYAEVCDFLIFHSVEDNADAKYRKKIRSLK